MKTEFKGLITDPTIYNTCDFCKREDNILAYLDSTRLKDTKWFCCEKCETEWRECYDRSR